jgi:hypothetical protein
MMYGPTNAKDHEKETAGAIMVTPDLSPHSPQHFRVNG